MGEVVKVEVRLCQATTIRRFLYGYTIPKNISVVLWQLLHWVLTYLY
jgi:hypothetical protein